METVMLLTFAACFVWVMDKAGKGPKDRPLHTIYDVNDD